MTRPAGPAAKAFALVCYAAAVAGMAALAVRVLLLGLDVLPAAEPAPGPWPWLANAGWLLLFGLQHSGMARRAFKRPWTRLVPAHLERSVYAAVSGLLLLGLALAWQPLPGPELWRLPWPAVAVALAGWAGATLISLRFDHLGLFGVRQVWEHGREATPDRLYVLGPYRYVRHPVLACTLLFLWGQPVMTPTLAALSGGLTLYVLIGLQFEERDLLARFGPAYAAYRRRVPALLPWRPPAAPATYPPIG